jgi:hypothetical protein
MATAESFDFVRINTRLVVYLYNSFVRLIIEQLLEWMPLDAVVIYNNPLHSESFFKHEVSLLHESYGWNPSVRSMIFKKSALEPLF